ncbi:hypothetical protein HYQ45_002401 [Verticillium longisporum]|uniref:Uncharacterized protein n=1 Tax=Verticillium longisporum TaxID=100787 RepID=A0A8I3A073_VERLO|nr:hypothetical protein HYQ45_002401 [Verticillium longisporum]
MDAAGQSAARAVTSSSHHYLPLLPCRLSHPLVMTFNNVLIGLWGMSDNSYLLNSALQPHLQMGRLAGWLVRLWFLYSRKA